jgi:hypothetical protein
MVTKDHSNTKIQNDESLNHKCSQYLDGVATNDSLTKSLPSFHQKGQEWLLRTLFSGQEVLNRMKR